MAINRIPTSCTKIVKPVELCQDHQLQRDNIGYLSIPVTPLLSRWVTNLLVTQASCPRTSEVQRDFDVF